MDLRERLEARIKIAEDNDCFGEAEDVRDALDEIERLHKIEQAAEQVVAFDWSQNTCVEALHAVVHLQNVLPSAKD